VAEGQGSLSEFPKLLTQPEVAAILRCSPYTVARLRKAGKLAYIPGKPVLIDEADVLAYVETAKKPAIVKPKPIPTTPQSGTPEYQKQINE
jgi:excisionase family DNA binding protein